MGNLTDDMTRLRGEVDALRGARGVLMQELTRGARDLTMAVAAMRADFASAHAAMAKQTRGERGAFVAAVIDEVNSLLGEFSKDRNNMARMGRADRGTFLAEMRRGVMGLCKETADDLMGARLVWRGRSPEKYRPVRMKKEPVSAKPVSPPVEAVPKKTGAAPEFKVEKPLVAFKEPPKKEEEKKTVAVPEAQVVVTPKVKAPPLVSAPKQPFSESKEKSWLDETPVKAKSRAKRGRK